MHNNYECYIRIYKCYMGFKTPALTNQIAVFVTTGAHALLVTTMI